METEIEITDITEDSDPLFITVGIRFFQDETNETARGSRLFWTYEITKIKAVGQCRGETFDYDRAWETHSYEIERACRRELESFIKEIA